MPYTSNNDLPDSVKNNLPEHAQDIYRAAFNSALEQYQDESQAARVAWAAVGNSYEKNEDAKWIKKEGETK